MLKRSESRHSIRVNRRAVKYIAIAVIIAGLCFSAVNIIKYTRGCLAYQKGNSAAVMQPSDSLAGTKDTGSALARELAEQNADKITLYPTRGQAGDKLGELYIPRLDATLPIYQGTGEDELEKGVGHYIKSVLPGEKDNCVLSGHRDTVFQKLGEVKTGDLLVVSTYAGEFKYKVKKIRIVDKDDRTVIVPKPRAVLTVSTCYPFDYIGAAPKRYILVAYLLSQKLNN